MPRRYSGDRTTVHGLRYYFIRGPKYRNKVLTDGVVDWLESLIEYTADELELDIIELAIQPDHVHLFITGYPKLAPSEIIRLIKGYSSRVLRDDYDFGLPSLWTGSYFVSSSGDVSSQIVKGYIEAKTGQ